MFIHDESHDQALDSLRPTPSTIFTSPFSALCSLTLHRVATCSGLEYSVAICLLLALLITIVFESVQISNRAVSRWFTYASRFRHHHHVQICLCFEHIRAFLAHLRVTTKPTSSPPMLTFDLTARPLSYQTLTATLATRFSGLQNAMRAC